MQNEDGSRTVVNSARRGLPGAAARDVRGNTLAIVGAALVPLCAMIGSGLDMSRAYMAKTRLQSACDAAALAGRRIMNNDTMTEAGPHRGPALLQFQLPPGPLRYRRVHAGRDPAGQRHGPRHRLDPDSDHDHAHVRLRDAAAQRHL